MKSIIYIIAAMFAVAGGALAETHIYPPSIMIEDGDIPPCFRMDYGAELKGPIKIECHGVVMLDISEGASIAAPRR